MTARRWGVVGLAVGGALVLAALVPVALWVVRPAMAVEYPADPTDRPPPAVAFDPSTLTAPGCPTEQPDAAPATPGRAGEDRLVEWGAVRLVRCTYMLGMTTTAYVLGRIDVIDDQPKVTDAVRVLRRMLTTAQFDGYFGRQDNSVRNMAAFPTYRYLFQFPDGHVTEVDYRDGYHRDGFVRHRWSVRGSSIDPLEVPGGRACGVSPSSPCLITGAIATVPD
jgi:hypothetical protein